MSFRYWKPLFVSMCMFGVRACVRVCGWVNVSAIFIFLVLHMTLFSNRVILRRSTSTKADSDFRLSFNEQRSRCLRSKTEELNCGALTGTDAALFHSQKINPFQTDPQSWDTHQIHKLSSVCYFYKPTWGSTWYFVWRLMFPTSLFISPLYLQFVM